MTSSLTRRQALVLGGFGAIAVVGGGAGLLIGARVDPTSDVPAGTALRSPTVRRSVDGLLDVTLRAAPVSALIGGIAVAASGYEDGLPGPTLHVAPGDLLRVTLRNDLDEPTNLHVHGLQVSPNGNGDNVFLRVDPGDAFDYEYQIPADHPTGLFWYHPHVHEHTADQVFHGLFGAIVVRAADETPPDRDRVLIVSDIDFDDAGVIRDPDPMERQAGREGSVVLVNGQQRPRMSARPGERERWSILNACVSRYLQLTLDGQQFELAAVDSGRLPKPEPVDSLLLAPGNRVEVWVTAAAGDSVLRALAVDRGGMGMGMGGGTTTTAVVAIADYVVDGDPVTGATTGADGNQRLTASRDLRDVQPDARRRLRLDAGMAMGGMTFAIDGKKFDPDRTDIRIDAGQVEEWTIENPGPMNHPFHLHVWPMQVTASDRGAVEGIHWRDVVDIPAQGSVTVRIAFDGPVGRTVYHCHILDHEDAGMMGVIEVS